MDGKLDDITAQIVYAAAKQGDQVASEEPMSTTQFDASIEGAEDVDWTFLDEFFQASNSDMLRDGLTAATLGLN